MAWRYCAQVVDPIRHRFDSRLEPIAFDIYTGLLLTQRTQAHFAVSLNYFEFSVKYNQVFFTNWKTKKDLSLYSTKKKKNAPKICFLITELQYFFDIRYSESHLIVKKIAFIDGYSHGVLDILTGGWIKGL